MGQLVNSRIFGKETKPTIYYILGYGLTIEKFKIPIFILSKFGFRIMAFEIDTSVFSSGDPKILKKALAEFLAVVRKDMPECTVAGAYGISLGSFFAMNLLALPEVDKAFLNTGGGSIVHAVWEMPVLRPIKRGFINNGYDRAAMDAYWDPIDVSQHIAKIKGKQLYANASHDDEYIPIQDVLRHEKEWRAEGVHAKINVYKRFNHSITIMRTVIKFSKTAAFFRSGL